MIPFRNPMIGHNGGPELENTAEGGQFVYTGTTATPETTWTVPAGVYSIAILAIGTGGSSTSKLAAVGAAESGSGGDLRYINNVSVTPGEILKVSATSYGFLGQQGRAAYVKRNDDTFIVQAKGGVGSSQGGGQAGVSTTIGGDVGGGNGGLKKLGSAGTNAPGGGGAGGYSGNGGDGAIGASSGATAGAGGGGGGGNGGATSGYSGGGVGIYGEGVSGAIATSTTTGGGSGGGNGVVCPATEGTTQGGLYGAGAGGYDGTTAQSYFQKGGPGVVRIVWGKGPENGGRAFPSTLVSTREGHAGNADVLYGLGATLAAAVADAPTVSQNLRNILTDGVSAGQNGVTATTSIIAMAFPEPQRYVTSIVVAALSAGGLNGAKIEKKKAGVWTTVTASISYPSSASLVTVAISDTVEAIAITKTGYNINEFRAIY